MSDKKLLPPKFNEDRPYEEWSRLVKWWQIQTDIPAAKQGIAVASSSLTGKALDAVLQLTDDEINCAEGFDNVLKKLDGVYKKNSLTKKIEDIENFETLKREDSTSIKEFIADFEKCVGKLKTHAIVYPKDVEGYKLLKGANLPPNEEKMIRASSNDIEYDSVHAKLKQIYGDERPSAKDFSMKAEPTFVAETGEYEEQRTDEDENEAEEVMYSSSKRYSRDRPRDKQTNNRFTQSKRYGPSSSSGNWRDKEREPPKGRNPQTRSGFQTRCRICQSINHWENKCPDKDVADTAMLMNEVVLHASDDVVLNSLLSETWSCAVLDCGATNTVCGSEWFKEFVNSLPPEQRNKIQVYDSAVPFRFGDGVVLTSNQRSNIPAVVGEKPITIVTEVVEASIPLLLSIKSMKRGGLKIDFGSDQLLAFGQEIPLLTTKSGLYALPLTKPKQLLTNFNRNENLTPITLRVTDSKTNVEIAKKLHRCFAHPSSDRLLRMVNAAGEEWANNENLKAEIRKISNDCDTCKIFKKAPPRPIVGLPMASEFNETVAMDLKHTKGSKSSILLISVLDSRLQFSFLTKRNPQWLTLCSGFGFRWMVHQLNF